MDKDKTPRGVRTIRPAMEEQILRSSAAPNATKEEVLLVANACSADLRACKD